MVLIFAVETMIFYFYILLLLLIQEKLIKIEKMMYNGKTKHLQYMAVALTLLQGQQMWAIDDLELVNCILR